MKDRVYKVVCAAIDEINEQFSDNLQLGKETSSILFGSTSTLDSLGLVNLLVEIEQNIEDEFDVSLSIANEKAMSQNASPFKTVGSLTEFIFHLLKDAENE